MRYVLNVSNDGTRSLSSDSMDDRKFPSAELFHFLDAETCTPVETLVQIFTGSVDINERLNQMCQTAGAHLVCDHSLQVELPSILFNHCLNLLEQLEDLPFEYIQLHIISPVSGDIEPTDDWSYRWIDGQNNLHRHTAEANNRELTSDMDFWKGWHHRQVTNNWLRDGLALFMTWTAAGQPGQVRPD